MGTERRTQKAPAGGRARLGRDFWFYFSGQAVSQLGGSFTNFALPLLVFKLTHSATNLALTTAAEFVPYLLFGLPFGAVVDRFDRKRLMLGSDIAQAFVIAVIPVLAIGGSLRVADIYAVTFVQSTLGIIFNCGEFAAIPALVGERELVTANARIMATNNAGQILGPGLAGALVAFVPVAGLLFVDAGSFLVSSGCLALIRCSFNAGTPARRPADSAIRALLADVREGLAYVWSNPVLRSISIMMALINLVAATANSQLVLFARRALHATNSEIGFLYAAGAVGIVAVSLVAGPIRRRVSFAVTALGAVSGLWHVAQHQHRRPAPGDRPAPALRAGGKRRPGPGLVGHPPRVARRGGSDQPERECRRRLRRHRRSHRRHSARLRLQPGRTRGPLPLRGGRAAGRVHGRRACRGIRRRWPRRGREQRGPLTRASKALR
jgi:Na+/melibiose symporter-like transporter